jgi:hypothetical protein
MRTLPALLLLALLVPAPARAEESPQTMAMEFRVGMYAPEVDSEFAGDVHPFRDAFGKDDTFTWGGEYDVQFWHGFGSLGAFGAVSWGRMSGKGLLTDGSQSSDETTMTLLPFVVGAVYRFDVLATRFNVPFVLALKGGLDYTVWTIDDGVGDTSEYETTDKETVKGEGGTWGLYGAVSLHLLLDFFEPHAAKVFDNDLGVNNSYLFAEYAWWVVDDFGSSSSFNLSDSGLVFGLAFEM